MEEPVAPLSTPARADLVARAKAMLRRAALPGVGGADAPQKAVERVDDKTTPLPRRLLALAQARMRSNEAAGAAEAAALALELAPKLKAALVVLAWAAAFQGDAENALSLYRRVAEAKPDAPRWRAEIVRILNICGRVAEARSETTELARLWPEHPMARKLTFTAPNGAAAAPSGGAEGSPIANMGAPADSELQRPLLADDAERDVFVAQGVGAKAVAVVFAGNNDLALGLPLSVFDRYLAALGVDAIYLKDHSRLFFLSGVRSLRRYEAALESLRTMLAKLPAARLHMIGMSGGGPAAIRYGVDLGAQNIVSFCGPTKIDFDRLPAPVHRILAKRLQAAIPAQYLDARLFLEARDVRPRIHMVYGAEMARDRAYAEHLAGMPMVTLRPLAGFDRHEIFPALAATGELRTLLGELLG